MYAHQIRNSTVDGDAYYVTKTNTTVAGRSYYPWPDKPTTSFPISDALIAEWEADAEAGGIITSPCPYLIKTAVTLGPIKINCDVEVTNSGAITVAGPIWISGNFTIKNNGGMYIDPSVGSKSVALIVDKVSDRLTSSKASIENSTVFYDSGTAGSFLFLISGNTSKESGGSGIAIDLRNTADGAVVLYSNHGQVDITQSSKLKSVTGYLISMKNSAKLIYDTGLESNVFDTGPGGSWNVTSWQEGQ
jgi:hypothetical protein